MPYQTTCFIKPDLDTVVTACLLRHRGLGLVRPLPGEAPDAFLDSKDILCIECGGSGRVEDADFDHHGRSVLPCAAEQAWEHIGQPTALAALVGYTARVDTGKGPSSPDAGGHALCLSGLFSGMRLCQKEPLQQFMSGLALVGDVLRLQLPPEDVTPLVQASPAAARYAEAKRAAVTALERELMRAVFFAVGPWTVGALETPLPGVHGLLRRKGADISIAGTPASATGAHRWSVSVRPGLEGMLRNVLPVFAAREAGWGGPAGGGIICGPRQGSTLDLADVRSLLEQAWRPIRQPM